MSLLDLLVTFLAPRVVTHHRALDFDVRSSSLSKISTAAIVEEFVSPHYRRHCEARRPPRRIASDKDAEALAWWLKREGGPPTAVLCIDRLDGSRLSVEGLRRLRGCIATIDGSDGLAWYHGRVRPILQALGELGDAVTTICLGWYNHGFPQGTNSYDVINDFYTLALSQLHGLRVIRGRGCFTARTLAIVLRHTPYVREISIYGTFLNKETPKAVDALAEVLRSLPLEVVVFTSSRMGDDAFARLAPALASASSTLTELDLSYCDLHDCSAPLLSSVLVQCAALRVLRIECNYLSLQDDDDSLDEEYVVEDILGAGLKKLSCLMTFSFSAPDYSEIFKPLARLLTHWPMLDSFRFVTTNYCGIDIFAEHLELSRLRVLSLQHYSGCQFEELTPLIVRLPPSLKELVLIASNSEWANDEFADLVAAFEAIPSCSLHKLTVHAWFTPEEAAPLWRRLHAVIPDVDLGGHRHFD